MKEKQKDNKKKELIDPYLKPVIIGGLFNTILSMIFAPGIFIWSALSGYIAVITAYNLTRKLIPTIDGVLIGVFTGIFGGTFLDVLTIISLKTPENQRLIIRTLEKNWPKELSIPANLNEILPSVFITTSILIILVSIICAVVGSCLGMMITRKKKEREELK